MHIRLPLNWRTRNYVGTIFGGSMYGAVDPIYMGMFIKILGPGYVVWDKAAGVRFKRTGTSTLHAKFVLTGEEIEGIRREAAPGAGLERVYQIDLVDGAGVVHAAIEKTVYVKKK